jgi:hypothetical protein
MRWPTLVDYLEKNPEIADTYLNGDIASMSTHEQALFTIDKDVSKVLGNLAEEEIGFLPGRIDSDVIKRCRKLGV